MVVSLQVRWTIVAFLVVWYSIQHISWDGHVRVRSAAGPKSVFTGTLFDQVLLYFVFLWVTKLYLSLERGFPNRAGWNLVHEAKQIAGATIACSSVFLICGAALVDPEFVQSHAITFAYGASLWFMFNNRPHESS